MATIYNSELTAELIQAGKLQVARDKIPSEIAEKVVPVIDVNPKHARICNLVKRQSIVNSASGIIYSVPSSKKTFICGYSLSVIKDVTSTSDRSKINCYLPSGEAITIAEITGITLTPQEQTITATINPPLELQPGTNIDLTNSTNVANINTSGIIWGFEVLNPKS